MAEFLYRLGQASARHARRVVAIWFAVLLLAGIAFAVGAGTLSSTVSIPGTRTAQVTDRLKEVLPVASSGTGTIVFATHDGSPLSEAQRTAISERVAEARRLSGVKQVVDPFETEQVLVDRKAEIAKGRDQIEQGRKQLDAARAKLDAGQSELDAGRKQAEAAGMLGQLKDFFASKQGEIDRGRMTIEARTKELEQGLAQLDEGERLAELSSGMRMVSSDSSTAIVMTLFDHTQLEVTQAEKDALIGVFDRAPVPGVDVSYSAEIASGIPALLGAGEVIGLVVAGVVLIVMLGTLIGAGLPILTAIIGVAIGALTTMSLSGIIEMASVTPILGVMLGLAVGIDYSLFIINRHRRQLKQGYDVDESIGLATGTSGNAVVFAGSTVLIALLALNVTGIPFLGLMGTVGALSIAIAVLIAVTLTPALLGLIGLHILSRRERAVLDAPDRVREALLKSRARPAKPMSMARAISSIVFGVGALVVLALPSIDLRLGLPDGSAEAVESTQYQAYSTVADKFGPGRNTPLVVVADLAGVPAGTSDVTIQRQIAEALTAQPDVVGLAPVGLSKGRTVAAFQVIPKEGPNSPSTEALVHTLRALEPMDGAVRLDVAGMASGNIDISAKLAQALPLYLALVVGLSLVILVLVFRSIFVPVIATLGFVLSYYAAMGGVVAIYQWGWLASIFGVDHPSPILSFLPTMLAGILFGLAMDYMLFLGSGMREAYVHGAPARTAVTHGLHAGRSVVAAAAIIMISVFGGFIFSHSAMIRPIGFGLAFGVLVDAFIVRMLIVPALMHLAGDKAWWLPTWLDRKLPNLDVEGAALERKHPHVEHHEEALVR